MRTRFRSIFNLVPLLALVASLLGSALAARPAHAAATILVNSALDVVADDGQCTLREAITAANTNTASGGTPGECAAGDASGTDQIHFAAPYTITLDAGLGTLQPSSNVQINGVGTSSTIIQASTCDPTPAVPGCTIATYPVFSIATGNATLNQITIRYGATAGGGGGVYNNGGVVTVTNSLVSHNQATAGGGGLYNQSGTLQVSVSTVDGNVTAGSGGGIYNQGSMPISYSTFSNNVAAADGGAVLNTGTGSIWNSTFAYNSAFEVAAIYNNTATSTLSVYSSTVSNNTASVQYGGIYNEGSLDLRDSMLANNTAYDCFNSHTMSGDVQNLIESNPGGGSDCGTPSVTSDPGTLTWGPNGGSTGTNTFAIDSSSSAYEAGDLTNCLLSPVNGVDQRLVHRKSASCDIGAYDFHPAPANDEYAGATLISSLPYSNAIDAAGATTGVAPADPSINCVGGQRTNSVWYQFTPASNGMLKVNTFGSLYDTVLQVWTGSPGSFTSVACDDDNPVYGLQSSVVFFASGGTTYTIEVVAFSAGGGPLALRVAPSDVAADFDANGATDVGVYRPSTHGWFVKGLLATVYGIAGDIPVSADYDGNGTEDVAVFRPASAGWFVQGQSSTVYGIAGDVPVPGDYNGDGITDIAVYRPSTSAWYIRGQSATIYGLPGDIPIPRDYNGDGTTDIAVFRPSTRGWFVKNQFSTIYGLAGDIPVPADYDGNGTADVAVYRPSTSGWFVQGQSSTLYGLAGDLPVPGDYDHNGTADIAVFRPSTNAWFVKGQFATIYGLTGDFPLPVRDTNADGDPYQ